MLSFQFMRFFVQFWPAKIRSGKSFDKYHVCGEDNDGRDKHDDYDGGGGVDDEEQLRLCILNF